LNAEAFEHVSQVLSSLQVKKKYILAALMTAMRLVGSSLIDLQHSAAAAIAFLRRLLWISLVSILQMADSIHQDPRPLTLDARSQT
jgi:hypothetical protein